jgi:hypothetical protein
MPSLVVDVGANVFAHYSASSSSSSSSSVLIHVVSRAGGILFPAGAVSRLPRHCARARLAHDAVSNRSPSLTLHRTLLLEA